MRKHRGELALSQAEARILVSHFVGPGVAWKRLLALLIAEIGDHDDYGGGKCGGDDEPLFAARLKLKPHAQLKSLLLLLPLLLLLVMSTAVVAVLP